MAIVKTDDKHYKDIANKIRQLGGGDETYKPEEMAQGVFEAAWKLAGEEYALGNEAGKQLGIEQGKQAEYDRFWDEFQQNGERTFYAYGFSGSGWNAETFKPKYPIVPRDSAHYMFSMFGTANATSGITDCMDFREVAHLIDLSNARNVMGAFSDARIDYIDVDLSNATNLTNAFSESYYDAARTSIKLKISEKATTGLSNAFLLARKLNDLIFKEGSVIAASINLQYSPLTKASIESVVAALSPTVTGQTATFKKTAKEVAFTADEWAALIATKSNWTFSLV